LWRFFKIERKLNLLCKFNAQKKKLRDFFSFEILKFRVGRFYRDYTLVSGLGLWFEKLLDLFGERII